MKWGSKGTADGQFRGPSGLSIDADDNIYVTTTEFRYLLATENS